MLMRRSGMRIPWILLISCVALFLCVDADDYDSPETPPPPPVEMERCNGIFLTYTFEGREKEYPLVKNVSAQAWSFKATASVLNTGSQELKAWKMFIGFQHNELLVSVDGAVVVADDDGFPIKVGNNGTVLAGFPMVDLKTAVDTAADFTQMGTQVSLKGSMFGGTAKTTPMPKTIKLVNDGFKCPAPTRKGGYMHVCCVKDPKYKVNVTKTKFFPRVYGDLHFTYDVLRAYGNKYLAQVTIDNNHPLGRLDQWNLTWEWMRNEFIYDMRGAYTHKKDPSECIYGPQGQYYKDFDFSNVMNCQKKPVISDLPSEMKDNDKVGKLPYCCKNGVLLPKIMNETKSRAIFQMEVFKLPPDMNRTAITPPQNWKIEGRVNPHYKCGPPVRVDPTEFPDPSGIDATTSAIASWQINCNMTKPKPKQSKCCVSYTAYYSDAAVPCSTCACGCDDDARCDKDGQAMLIPSNALLVPFVNRTAKAKAYANIKKKDIPKKLPCPDNCGVSINWHIDSDYKSGWTARVTLFNWDELAFADWFSAVQLKKAFSGFEKMYSFNATAISKGTNLENTIFMQGLPGLNYLVGEVNGTNPQRDPRVPGKQQSVISFSKSGIHGLDIPKGDGFPTKLFFNGGECALPTEFPKKSSANRALTAWFPSVLLGLLTFLLLAVSLN